MSPDTPNRLLGSRVSVLRALRQPETGHTHRTVDTRFGLPSLVRDIMIVWTSELKLRGIEKIERSKGVNQRCVRE